MAAFSQRQPVATLTPPASSHGGRGAWGFTVPINVEVGIFCFVTTPPSASTYPTLLTLLDAKLSVVVWSVCRRSISPQYTEHVGMHCARRLPATQRPWSCKAEVTFLGIDLWVKTRTSQHAVCFSIVERVLICGPAEHRPRRSAIPILRSDWFEPAYQTSPSSSTDQSAERRWLATTHERRRRRLTSIARARRATSSKRLSEHQKVESGPAKAKRDKHHWE